jgi:hypothetical protein
VLLPSSLRASWHWTLQQQQAVPQCSVARRLSVISEWLKWIIADFGTIERAQNSKRAGSTMDASTPPQRASWTTRTGTRFQRLCILRARGRGHPGPPLPGAGQHDPARSCPGPASRPHAFHTGAFAAINCIFKGSGTLLILFVVFVRKVSVSIREFAKTLPNGTRSIDREVVYSGMTDWRRFGRAPDFSQGRLRT